jgi:hypothetical protein
METAGALSAALRGEADAGALPRLLGFDGAVPGRRTSMERINEHAGNLRNLAHRLLEGSLIDLRGFAEAADLAHKLERGCADLLVGRGRLKIEKRSNVTAHARNTALLRVRVKRPGCERAMPACSVRWLGERSVHLSGFPRAANEGPRSPRGVAVAAKPPIIRCLFRI